MKRHTRSDIYTEFHTHERHTRGDMYMRTEGTYMRKGIHTEGHTHEKTYNLLGECML